MGNKGSRSASADAAREAEAMSGGRNSGKSVIKFVRPIDEDEQMRSNFSSADGKRQVRELIQILKILQDEE